MDAFMVKRTRSRSDESTSDESSDVVLEQAKKRHKFVSSSGCILNLCIDIATKLINTDRGLNVIYYPCFMKEGDSKAVLKDLEEVLRPYFEISPNIVKLKGKVMPIPRQQTVFGDEGLRYSYSGVTLARALASNSWIPIISSLKSAVEWAADDTFNFVLINRYKDGEDYMGEHRDDERDLDPSGMIASLSFGAERDFVFRHAESRGKNAKRKEINPIKITLLSGSLLLMKPPTNREWYHSLPVRKGVHDVRINLTFRRVLKKTQ